VRGTQPPPLREPTVGAGYYGNWLWEPWWAYVRAQLAAAGVCVVGRHCCAARELPSTRAAGHGPPSAATAAAGADRGCFYLFFLNSFEIDTTT